MQEEYIEAGHPEVVFESKSLKKWIAGLLKGPKPVKRDKRGNFVFEDRGGDISARGAVCIIFRIVYYLNSIVKHLSVSALKKKLAKLDSCSAPQSLRDKLCMELNVVGYQNVASLR